MDRKHLYEIRISEVTCHVMIRDIKINISANQHAKAKLEFDLLDSNEADKLFEQVSGEKVTVVCREEVIFCGKCVSIQVSNKDKAELELISSSIMLDKNMKKKSYQDIQMTWEQIMSHAISLCGGILEYNSVKGNPNMPVIQYAETTWEFIRRLASKVNTMIYPDYKYGKSKIFVGLPEGKNIEISSFLKKSVFDDNYWLKHEYDKEKYLSDFVYYEVWSYENYEIGTIVNVDKTKMHILEKRIETINGDLAFIYRMGSPEMVCLDTYDNKKFAGMTIQGTVLNVEKETVKLHFEFDKEQSVSTAYPYSWTPESGNTMYLMPKVGTIVNLFFMNENEESALAISCIRENGKSHSKLQSVDNRYLTNETGKQIYLKPKEMGFINEETNEGISILDNDKIQLETSNNISIISNKKLCISAKDIIISTPNEFLAKKIYL